jgi:hypothetical protein
MKKLIKKLFLLVGFLIASSFIFTISSASELKQNVFNPNGYPIGIVNTDGKILSRLGRTLGSVNKNGVVFNRYGKKVGSVDLNGNLYSVTGIKIGKVKRSGKVFNRNGYHIGFIKAKGNIYRIGGAAIIINLKSPRNWKAIY